MKKMLIVMALVIPMFWGCSDTILNPDSTNQTTNQKSWITLPKNPAMGVEEEYSASKVINGETGGTVELNVNYVTKSTVNVIINAVIEVPAGAYSGDKNITMIINSDNGTATFYPSPETFNKPLIFNLKINGVDLNGIDPTSIDYVYLAPDGSFAPIEYKKIVVNSGVLIVNDALIPHFTMYGWTR
jgi:hypothetical protein